jgi:iron complex outermembrane recepter protein
MASPYNNKARVLRATHRYRMRSPQLTAISIALAYAMPIAHAQSSAPQRVEPITISARSAPILDHESADVGGFATPLAQTPQSMAVFGADLLSSTATKTLSNAIRLDASLGDSYNTTGYFESLSVRGFTLDQATNFRRNGLATSNYAPRAFENIERIEVLKGVAGLQSGVSAPGGLVNYVTKQPLRDAFNNASVSVDRWGDTKAHIDSNLRLGDAGLRINLANERLRSQFDEANGTRSFASAALAFPLTKATALSAEFEYHRKSQPSVPGLGLLDRNGDGVAETLPPVLPRLNLNNQVWSLPVQSRSTNASIALKHRFNERWSASLAASHFQSKVNDRVAFPDGCSTAANYVYPGLCANGDVDVYDFRSDNERRRLTGWEAKVQGTFDGFGVTHATQWSLSGRDGNARFPAKSAYNFVGTTNIFSPVVLPADPSLTTLNTNTADRAIDATISLQSNWNAWFATFAGVRYTRAHRESERTDGSQRVAFSQSIATPWIAFTAKLAPSLVAYASWGQGVEIEAVPNRPLEFANFGEALPALKSKQIEIGAKWQAAPRLLLTGALFSIEKPLADDTVLGDDFSNADGLRTRIAGGKLARHRGIELGANGRISDALSVQWSATYLDARYVRAIDPRLVDQRVTNVPHFAASLFADYKIAAIDGLSLNALAWAQRGKSVVVNGSVSLPNAWQIDLGASYVARIATNVVTTRVGIENVTNRIFWREAPTTSWGGTYLFPSTSRALRASVSVDF